jgi:hypothetical protein
MKPLKAGSLVRVKFDNGRIVDGRVKAVVVQTNGEKYQVSWGYETARVGAKNIIEKLD